MPYYVELVEKIIRYNKELGSFIGKREDAYMGNGSFQQTAQLNFFPISFPRYLATTNLSLQNNKSPSRADGLRFNLSPKALGHIQNVSEHRLKHANACRFLTASFLLHTATFITCQNQTRIAYKTSPFTSPDPSQSAQ